jgi:glutathione S-transferase
MQNGEATYRHFGWECSPYSSKTRSYLRYKQIPHVDIYPTIFQLKRVIEKRVGFLVMPIMITPENTTLQDSSEIIDTLESRFKEHSITPPGPTQQLVSLLMELHADEWMTIIAMHTRWNNPVNRKFIRRDFGAQSCPWLPRFLHPYLGKKIAEKMRSYLPLLGINEDTVPAIESWMTDLFDNLDSHFSEHHFLLGGRPCLGDFALYGPLYAHVWRDPGSRNWITSRRHLDAWVERMREPSPQTAGFLPGDQVPGTLDAIFQRVFSEQFSVLSETVEQVSVWCKDNPGQKKIPRGIGQLDFKLGDVQSQRKLLTFPYWMLQRPLGHYKKLSPDQRLAVDSWLEQVGGLQAMQIELDHELVRRNFRVEVAT